MVIFALFWWRDHAARYSTWKELYNIHGLCEASRRLCASVPSQLCKLLPTVQLVKQDASGYVNPSESSHRVVTQLLFLYGVRGMLWRASRFGLLVDAVSLQSVQRVTFQFLIPAVLETFKDRRPLFQRHE